MCDRILVLSSNPGRIAAEIAIPLPQPRNRLDASFRNIVDEIYATLTSRTIVSMRTQGQVHGGLVRALPQASINRISGLIETLAAPPYSGRAELATIAASHILDVDDLFPIAEALHILEFGELSDTSLKLTTRRARLRPKQHRGTQAPLPRASHQVRPLATRIRHVLGEREAHRAPRARFETELEDHLLGARPSGHFVPLRNGRAMPSCSRMMIGSEPLASDGQAAAPERRSSSGFYVFLRT